MPQSVAKSVTLNNGVVMPTLGLGVWQIPDGEETEQAVRWALEAGYRLIDTATLYGNEASVGRAVRASAIPREEIFITTKLWPTDFLDPTGAFERSMERLDLGYVDLYLIHFPIPLVANNVWAAFEKLYAAKRVRAIGVSNYSVAQLEKLLATASTPPAVNQVRFNPFSYKKDVLEFCNTHHITLEAYSPLTQGDELQHPTIAQIATAHHKSPAQVLIRWALQHGTVVIPKSNRKDRIEENAQVFDFELTAEEMKTLDELA